jgi:transposase
MGMSKRVVILGIDLAKNVFQLHGIDQGGHVVLKRRLTREKLAPTVAQLEACTIVIEACTGAFYWARVFQQWGHTVRVIGPQYVKPFVKGNKNDGNDAEALCEAVQRPRMRFVPLKTLEQQDVQALHRARQRLVNHRTALIAQMRGLLLDRGIAFAPGASRTRRMIPRVLEDEAALTPMSRETIAELYEFLQQIDQRIANFDRRIARVFQASEVGQRLAHVEGVGPKTATALVAAVGDAREFSNGRHLAAWLGLVPKHRASGDRRIMLGISKHGDQHLRTLLIHGARAVVRVAHRKCDPRSTWINALQERRGTNRTIVAVANKNARILWALLAKGECYRAAAV